MNKLRCIVAGITFLLLGPPIRAEISTVFLATTSQTNGSQPTNNEPLAIAQQKTATLSFNVVAALTAPSLKSCMLRVVPIVSNTNTTLGANQDVVVLGDSQQVGQWSISGYKTKPYLEVPLKIVACREGPRVLTLKTNSPKTEWQYKGANALSLADRPRLIVTYSNPAPARSGDATEWRYQDVSSFWFRGLWQVPTNVTASTNPTPYNGAVYFVAGSPAKLYRVALGENPRSWELKGKKVASGSFIFITGWGRLRIVTQDAIHSCDLNVLQQPNKYDDTQACTTEESPKEVTVNSNEQPAMGADGTLYFKNVKAGGSVVAFNPSSQELWRTDFVFTAVSPISLDASGRYAYLLGVIKVGDNKKAGLFAIDTVSGQTFHNFIAYKQDNQNIEPDLATLWKPAVVTKVEQEDSVDYVFVAGNTNNTGVLQLVKFDGKSLDVEWDQLSKITAPPVLSVDGNSVLVASVAIARFEWYSADPNKTGVFAKTGLKTHILANNYQASRIFVDGGGLVYVNANNHWYVYDASPASPNKPRAFMQVERAALDSQFTDDGRLILWTGSSLDTIVPKSDLKEVPKELVNGTIYSADTVDPEASSASQVKSGDRVILRGSQVTFPNEFNWPVGATLTVQGIPR